MSGVDVDPRHRVTGEVTADGGRMVPYKTALSEALAQEMRRDERVIVYGLDVQDHKQTFGSVAGLRAEFGDRRVFGTPLSEDAMTGVALGAALAGLRPVHVHIRADFMLLGMSQIANMISSYRYTSGGQLDVPLVIRAIIGRGWGQGAQHSKSMHGVFAHFPGLRVIMPATPRDAKGMLAAAIQCDDPVICLEHRWLYEVEGCVPEAPYTTSIDAPRVMREGSDVTIVATSWMTVEAMQAARLLDVAGVSVEVVDVRSVAPLRGAPIFASVAKTGRAIVADCDWTFCGLSAELAAQISSQCFGDLRHPVERLGFAHTPCPTTRPLEDLFYPSSRDIVRCVERLLDLPPMELDTSALYSWTNRFKGPF